MTDLEMTRLCAEAMGYDFHPPKKFIFPTVSATRNQLVPFVAHNSPYDPLHDDAQAMALVKKFELNIGPDVQGEDGWSVSDYGGDGEVFSQDLNRAIVECVAKMQQANK